MVGNDLSSRETKKDMSLGISLSLGDLVWRVF